MNKLTRYAVLINDIGKFCLTEAEERQIDWVLEKIEQLWKARHLLQSHDKNDSGDVKSMVDKSTIFIIWEAL